MNLIIHQLKKDLLRTRVLVILWLLLVAGQLVLVGWQAKPGDTVMQMLSTTLPVLVAFFNAVLVVVLIPLLVQQEPLVGTTAFWLTRPIGRADLLLSKSIYVLVLVLAPIGVQSLVFLANGVTVPDTALAAPELFISRFSWIIIVATVAVLTPSFSRFAVVAAVIFMAWVLALFVLQIVGLALHTQAFINTPPSLTASRSLVVSIIAIGFGGAAVILQYLVRRRKLVIILAAAAGVLALLTQYFMPWNFLKPPLRIVPDAGFQSAAVSAKLTSPVNVSDQMEIRGGTPLKQVQATIDFPGQAKGYVIKVTAIDSVLRSADGRAIPLEPAAQQNYLGNPDPEAVELAMNGVPVVNMENTYQMAQTLFSLKAEIYRQYARAPLSYAAGIDCVAYKYVVAVELPLRKGADFNRGSEHLQVTDVLEQPPGIDLVLRRRDVHLLFARRGDDESPFLQNRISGIYLLLNKSRHQAVLQKQAASVNFSMMNGSILINEPVRIPFGPPNDNSQKVFFPPLDHAWLAGATLVRLDLVPVAAFHRNLPAAGFWLDGETHLPASRTQAPVADLAALAGTALPHDPTRAQVRNYITDILVASRRINEDQHDPQVGMLEQVGAENVDLLIQAARENHNYYLNRAINKLAQPDQKGMVIEAMATNHDLINTVIDHGWQSDAKATLLSLFTAKADDYPDSWALAVASLKDPATYGALEAYYGEHPGDALFKALQTLPNFNLAETVDLAWKKSHNGQFWKIRNMLQPAAQFGEPDVIETAIKILKSSDGYSRQAARDVLKQYTPATGKTDADLIAWWNANRANLVFDSQAGKFVLRAAAAPTASPTVSP